jgi:hypothetical protein
MALTFMGGGMHDAMAVIPSAANRLSGLAQDDKVEVT